MKSTAIVVAALIALSGCAAAHTQTATAADVQGSADAYAAALSEAFDSYESEVQTASALRYTSQAEATAVMLTLSDSRLDVKLRESLARRGLSVRGLASYAEENPAFFHDQQRTYWGRLKRIEQTVASLPTRVEPSEQQMAALDAELAE